MRLRLATAQATVFASLLAVSLFAGTALAERKVFILSSNSGGYGVDRCLANGEKCGTAAANSYCKSQNFAAAASFQKVDRDEITGSIPTGQAGGCTGANCDMVAIVCQR